MMSDYGLNSLIESVQSHVPKQPWGRNGYEPMPVQIWFNQRQSGRERDPWVVEFVAGLNRTGSKRVWRTTSGATLEEALSKARRVQRSTPQHKVKGDDDE